MNEAVSIALGRQDPTVIGPRERATALGEKAVSEGQLPDPTMQLRMLNMPIDTFNFTQEPNTQAQIGLRQQFPPGQTLTIKRQRRLAEARQQDARAVLRELEITLDTRVNWLELYYWIGALRKINESKRAVSELVSVAKAIFASGRNNTQDVLRAELELDLLGDRLIEAKRRQETIRADLSRFIGQAAQRQLTNSFPSLPLPQAEDVVRNRFVSHPSVLVEDARIEARERDIDLAEQQYKPKFSVDMNYGYRGGNRSDFLTGTIGLSLPIFPHNRQDRDTASAFHQRFAALMDRDARLLELNKQLKRTYADWRQLGRRVSLYNQAVLKRATDTTKASLTAYRAGVSDFAELIRSRLALLRAELMLLRLRVDRARAQARLLFLAGN